MPMGRGQEIVLWVPVGRRTRHLGDALTTGSLASSQSREVGVPSRSVADRASMRDRLFDTAETARTSAGHCRRATVKLDEFTRRWPASVADRLPGNLTVAEEKLTAADTAFDAATSACIEAEGDVTGAQ